MDLPDCRRPSERFPATVLELAAANTGTSVAGTKWDKLQHRAAVVAARSLSMSVAGLEPGWLGVSNSGPDQDTSALELDSAAPVLRAAPSGCTPFITRSCQIEGAARSS